MGAKAGKENSLAANTNRQLLFFTEIHQNLTTASFSIVQNATSIPILSIINFFSPPQDERYKGFKKNLLQADFSNYQTWFPTCLDNWRVTAIDVSPITGVEQVETNGTAAFSQQHFTVKLVFDGSLVDVGIRTTDKLPTINFRLNSIEFRMTIDTADAKFEFGRISKSNNVVSVDLVVTNYNNVVTHVIPLRENYAGLVPEDEFIMEVNSGSDIQHALVNIFMVDLDDRVQLLSTTKELVSLRIKITQLQYMTDNKRWSMDADVNVLESDSVYLSVNSKLYFVNKVQVMHQMVLIASKREDEVLEYIRIQVSHVNSITSVVLTAERPLRKHVSSGEMQELSINPIDTLGQHSVTYRIALPMTLVKVPKFFKNHCEMSIRYRLTMRFTGQFEVEQLQSPSLDISLNPRLRFLDITGPERPDASGAMWLAIAFLWEEDNQISRATFHNRRLLVFYDSANIKYLSEPMESNRLKCYNLLDSLGSLLLDEFKWLRRRRVTSAAEELREYTIDKIVTKVDFERQLIVVTFTIMKHADKFAVQSQRRLYECDMKVDLDMMTVTVSQKALLGADLEFGIGAGESLLDTLWKEKRMSTDVMILFTE